MGHLHVIFLLGKFLFLIGIDRLFNQLSMVMLLYYFECFDSNSYNKFYIFSNSLLILFLMVLEFSQSF